MMKKTAIATSFCAISLLAMAQIVVPVRRGGLQTSTINGSPETSAPIVKYGSLETSAPKLYTDNAPFKADFTIEGAQTGLEDVGAYNFDNGYQGWTCDPTQYAVWSLKASPGTDPFSQYDPADVQSLYIEGDYRVYNREKSGAVSPKITIPANAVLNFYTYFSLNWDDACRLELSLSTDGFEEENIVLWNSGSETGERPSRWHPVSVDLADHAGKQVQFRLLYTYGSGDEIFKTGGYMGDFYIDGFKVQTYKTVDHIDVITGDRIHLMDITEGDITSWHWEMPGAVPSTSEEQNPTIYYTADGDYDISLTVTDAAGNADTKVMTGFVSVTGSEPTALINLPATFRLFSNAKRLPLVAPLAPVTFSDGSDGYPTAWKWTISGVDSDPDKLYTTTEEAPEVSFAYRHDQKATLEVENRHGKSKAETEFTVEYGGLVSNVRAGEGATNFDMGDWGLFPGSNTRKFSKFAERFSKPSRPLMVTGAYVFFNNADAGELIDQITSVGVHLQKSENGLPGEKIDDFWWTVVDLDTKNSNGDVMGTYFPFTYAPFVDDEFFIVVDGLPEYKEATSTQDQTLVSFLMTPWRTEGNTALFYRESDQKWTEAHEYFGAGKHTSFYIMPEVYHSVMAPLTNDKGELAVGKNAGTAEFQIFSYLGRTGTPEIDADWLRVASAPGEWTVDTLKIAYDKLPDGLTGRTGHITLTDGASKLTLTVIQNGETTMVNEVAEADGFAAILEGTRLNITGCNPEERLMIFSLSGEKAYDEMPHGGNVAVDISGWAPGLYIVINGKNTYKFII